MRVQAEDVLLAGAMEALVERLHSLLGYLSAAIREDLEVLSDQGRDRMFTCSSNLLEKINMLLARYVGAPLADAAVSDPVTRGGSAGITLVGLRRDAVLQMRSFKCRLGAHELECTE